MKSKTYVIVGIAILVLFASYYDWNSDRHFYSLLAKQGVYTIGTIVKVEGLSKGGPLTELIYHYRNVEQIGEYIGDLGSVQKPYIGKHFFIRIIPNDPKSGIYFNPNCLAPDSITVAPPDGWSQKWMRKHFPNCVK